MLGARGDDLLKMTLHRQIPWEQAGSGYVEETAARPIS
jgi:hypothetical protein